jgi:thioredoxin 2
MGAPLHVVCPNCATVNRVLPERRAQGHCGRCKQALFTGHPVALDESSFDAHVSKSEVPVVVDFWAPWCGPCLGFAPVFANAASQWEPRARLAKLDTEAQPQLVQRFNIRSIPTLVVLRHGREIARQSGALSATQLQQFIEGALARG